MSRYCPGQETNLQIIQAQVGNLPFWIDWVKGLEEMLKLLPSNFLTISNFTLCSKFLIILLISTILLSMLVSYVEIALIAFLQEINRR